MRKIDVEAKPEIDLQRKINVEMTLQELLVLKASVGEVSYCDISSHIDKFHVEIGGEVLSSIVIGDVVYDDLTELLENEGIKEDE